MPIGSGKSAIYQMAGLLILSPTVVISSLISLQRVGLVTEQGLLEKAG